MKCTYCEDQEMEECNEIFEEYGITYQYEYSMCLKCGKAYTTADQDEAFKKRKNVIIEV